MTSPLILATSRVEAMEPPLTLQINIDWASIFSGISSFNSQLERVRIQYKVVIPAIDWSETGRKLGWSDRLGRWISAFQGYSPPETRFIVYSTIIISNIVINIEYRAFRDLSELTGCRSGLDSSKVS